MAELCDDPTRDHAIAELAIPGSHNSFTNAMYPDLGIGPGPSSHLEVVDQTLWLHFQAHRPKVVPVSELRRPTATPTRCPVLRLQAGSVSAAVRVPAVQ